MMNFSRSYPRVVVYNGQQNFAIGDKETVKQLPQAPGETNPSSRSTAYYTIPAALALGAGGVYAAQNWGDLFPAEQTATINGYWHRHG